MMKPIKNLSQWKELKKNNQGSTLILVVVALGLIGILVAVVLSTSLMNYQMKYTALHSSNNFYTAEQALDEMKAGLTIEVSSAASAAYVSTMTLFSTLTEEERTLYFQENYVNQLRRILAQGQADSNYYSTDYLNTLIKTKPYDNTTKLGAYVDTTSVGLSNALSVTTKGMILKNVKVICYEAGDYMSQIHTDIVLNFPNILFNQTSDIPDLLNFALVADQTLSLDLGADVSLVGNVYGGGEGTYLNNSKLSMGSATEANALFITNNIQLNQGSTLNSSLLETWADTILVDASSIQMDGTTFLKNDLVLDNSVWNADSLSKPEVKAKISGELYAFGNVESAIDADAMKDSQSLISQDPAAYSSSVIVNGINATLDFSELTSMIISGHSYIAATKEKTSDYVDSRSNTDVSMGESFSIKANQKAYLIPASCVGVDSVYGGTNPMTATQYQNLLTDVGSDANLVSYDKKIDIYDKTLQELGVTRFQKEYFPVAHIGSMVYFFMSFDSQEQANSFFTTYYEVSSHLSELKERLDVYTKSILLPTNLLSNNNEESNVFYYQGNIIANDSTENTYYIPSLTTGITTQEEYQRITEEETANQDTFASLHRKLLTNYYQLTEDEKTKTVFDNLTEEMISSEFIKNIGPNSMKVFTTAKDAQESLCAVVVNGDYTYDSSTITGKDAFDETVTGRIALIIAAGNVTVSKDFSGLIMAGKDIVVSGSAIKIEADSKSVGVVLKQKNKDGVMAVNYLKNADSYVLGGGTTDSKSQDALAFSKLITYENWKKQ